MTKTPSAGDAAAVQRHLEDRERLLFTSRNVSVGEMASTLAHEINQPVGTVANVLRGALARLDTWPTDAEAQQQRVLQLQQGLRVALDQALFAGRIIGRIREYTHSRQPRRERVEVHALLRDSVALLDWEFLRDSVQVQLELAEGAAHVVGDEVMLQQVIVNLLRNAVDALRERDRTTATRRIRIRSALPNGAPKVQASTAKAGEIEISIADNGSGLSEEAEKNLFVPFQSTKPSGMGIGLNICRSFIELHQGRLWFTRPGVGPVGCCFHIALPLAG